LRRALAIALCASLAGGAAPAAAGAPPATPRADAPDPEDDVDVVERAEAAWGKGEWTEVRDLLEPVAGDPARLVDPRLRERALCLLADATVNDATLDEDERRRQASEHLERILDAEPTWRLPPAIYSPELFELFAEVQDARSQRTSAQCEADRMACAADLADATADLEELRTRYDALQRSYQDQEIEVRDRVARSRVFAAIPFGVGHFYNGDRWLGATFLAAEAAVGATGLGLILYRSVADGCRREEGYKRGSLVCANRDLDAILRRRKAEEAIGWVLLGTIALDVFLAQYRFRPFKTETVDRVPRRELDAGGAEGEGRPRRDRKPRPTVRPTASGSRHGASLGVTVRF
jgi:hypothetical protein